MSIDRRLRSASNELREVELAVPDRVPKGSRSPAMALPVLMLVFGAALAMTGLDRTPGSEPIAESAAIVVEPNTAEDVAVAPAATSGAGVGGSYDIEGELQLIRELRRRPSLVQSSAAPEPVIVAAPDANAELELIDALVNRPVATGVAEAPDAPIEPAPSRPIDGLS